MNELNERRYICLYQTGVSCEYSRDCPFPEEQIYDLPENCRTKRIADKIINQTDREAYFDGIRNGIGLRKRRR